MSNIIPSRRTYAQEKLLELINRRELVPWCKKNNLTAPTFDRIARGIQFVTYKIMSDTCHLIAPVEWLFFTDEKLPYEPQLVPRWDYTRVSEFVRTHRADYKALAGKYDISETRAFNIFVSYSAKPTPSFIRAACADVNPVAFFMDDEVNSLNYIPDRGEIVSFNKSLLLVLSSLKQNKKTGSFTGCNIEDDCENGIKLKGIKTNGAINISAINSYRFVNAERSPRSKCQPYFIERANGKDVERTLKAVRALFD